MGDVIPPNAGDSAGPVHETAAVSTGSLPSPEAVDNALAVAYARFRDDASGRVADYIPALAEADPRMFGLSVADVQGSVRQAGDAGHPFSIQSISKAFVFALVNQVLGRDTVRRRVGVNNTGLPFNSILAIELNDGSPMNPMVNAGALATTSLVPGADAAERWDVHPARTVPVRRP